MNTHFVARVMIAFLALLALALAALALALPRLFPGPPVGPTPMPPTIDAPAGAFPAGPVGLQEWAQYRGADYQLVGSGFFLTLPDSAVIAVTTAHSVTIGDENHPLQRVAFGVAGREGFVMAFDTLHGRPGRMRLGMDMTVDWVFLRVAGPVDPELALQPDPRGAPQPGERVTLVSGLGDGSGGRRLLRGSVQTSDGRGAWVVMDELFEPGQMSGSPFVSEHTGKVVGMALAAALRGDRLYVAMHPIGSLVAKALAADEFPLLSEHR